MNVTDTLLAVSGVLGGSSGGGGGGGGGYVAADWLDPAKPTGAIVSSAAITSSASYKYFLFGRTGITSVHLTAATVVPEYFCQGCTSLKSFVAEKGAAWNTFALGGCSALDVVDFGGTTLNMNFADILRGVPTTRALTIILRCTTVPALGVQAFRGSPVVNTGNCVFYIPKSLYDHLGDGSDDDYKAATNWSTIAARSNVSFAQIEGSVYETKWGDGTPIPTT